MGTDLTSRPLERTNIRGVYKRGNRYVVRTRINGREYKFAARTQKEARDIKAKARTSPDELLAPKQSERGRLACPLLSTYVETWAKEYDGRTRRGVSEQTRKEYKADLIRHVVPVLGRRRLDEITALDIERLVGRLRGKGLSDGSIRNAVVPLKALLRWAVRHGVIEHDPSTAITLPGRSRSTTRVLLDEELARLMGALPDDGRLVVDLIASTGLRASEAMGLRWKHVDFANGRLTVEIRRHGRDIAPPKTGTSRRMVPLSPRLLDLLRAEQDRQGAPPEGFVLLSPRGKPLDHHNFMHRTFHPARVAAGVEWAGLHTLRHTCATRLIRKGATALQVQRWLGHSSVAFTMETYVHLDDGDLPDPALLD
jgi:integrase